MDFFNIYSISILFSIFFVIFVLSLVRRRKLREQYSIMWLILGFVTVLVSLKTNWLEALATYLGIYYAPSLLFLIALLFCFAYLLHLTLVISKLSDRVVRLTQELALTQRTAHQEQEQESDEKLSAKAEGSVKL
ncbi:MAG TPA: DUF2304 domain-containing protein [Bacilli bacterium]|nr:DUF2304 domain-containing protein [Bacilli bacterium]